MRPRAPIFHFPFSLFCASTLCVLTSCGTPGDPTAPQPVVPEAITDLAARQAGGSVVLTFTLPNKSTEGSPLEAPPDVEIFRGMLPAGAPLPTKADALKQIYTVPSAVVDTYLREGRVVFTDPLKAEDLARHAGEQAAYIVRTRAPMPSGRASKKRASDDSNVVAVRIFPVPEAIADLRATVSETSIELRWTPPARTTAGTTIAALVGYRVYRAEVEPGTEATADPTEAKLKAPFELLGVAPAAAYRDTQFEFGRTYLYTVRSVAQADADSVESADCVPVQVTPRDTFPPESPRDLVVVVVPATAEAPAQLELSWAISTETDLAGYNIYRSESESAPAGRGERLNRELLPTPTFRDMSVQPGRRYFYRVTAVDRAGNESLPSAAASESVPPGGRQLQQTK